MKKYIYTAYILFISIAASAQTLYTTKRDSVPAQTDFFTLQSGSYRGTLQWQSSCDGKIWTNISGETQTELMIPTSTEAFYRAKLTDENGCFETYTDSAVVLTSKIQNTTVDPNAIAGTILIKTDGTTFTYKNIGNIQIGNGTLLVSNDSASNIRIVTSTSNKGDTLIVYTSQGSMANIFLNKSFKITTATTSSSQDIKALSILQKSQKLIDDFIYPINITNNVPELQKIKSTDITGNIPMLSFGSDFSGEKIYSDDLSTIEFLEGYYKFSSELKFEFEFEQPHFDFANLKFNAGRLKRFSFYTDPEVTGVDAKIILQAKTGGIVEFEKEITLKKDVLNKSFKFLVGEVPVWMDVTIDLMAKASGSISSEVSISGGASASAHMKLGAIYQNGVWTPDTAFVKTFTLEGPNVNGINNEKIKVEIYPHIDVKFYKLFGPWLDIAPYVSQEMNMSIDGNYDIGIYSGTDARLGVNITAFDEEVANYSYDFNLKKDTLYSAPDKIEIVSGNHQQSTPGDTLSAPIVVKVLDSRNNPLKNTYVYFRVASGKIFNATVGTLSHNQYLNEYSSDCEATELSILSDSIGQVSVKWILADTISEHKMLMYLKLANNSIISKSVTPVYATSCGCNTEKFGTFTDPRDGHVYKTITIGTQTWMAENLAYLPDDELSDPTIGLESYSNWETKTTPYYYAYDIKKYGVLYNWYAAMKSVPKGWHLPSDKEWKILVSYLGGDSIAGGKIKNTTDWNLPNVNATNSSCFTALPGGLRVYFGIGRIGDFGNWWSSTELNNKYAIILGVANYLDSIGLVEIHKYSGISVRCVKD